MTNTAKRARYTLEFKQEAVRLVEGGQSIAGAARSLGVVDQTLFNGFKAIELARSPAMTARS
jgi:transposase